MRPDHVRIVEVGPRDGLQNIKTTVSTSTKLELISRLKQSGLSTIELTSCVSPKAVPQMADCRSLLASPKVKDLLNNESLRLPVLVPNLKGLRTAIQNGVHEVAVFVSATEGFSRANTNCTVEEGLLAADNVAQEAKSAGLSIRGYVSCIFADPYDGPTPRSAVLHVVSRLLKMGCYEVSLGDTLGVGVAQDVKDLIEYLIQHGIALSALAGHFHDTYGQAVNNVWQAYRSGIRVFDSSVGGLGGCPFAPGAKGNVATEDIVYLFHNCGIHTGVDLHKLAEVGTWISTELKKINDSRAGAALTTKTNKNSIQKDTANSQKEATKIQWKLIKDEGGLKISQAGFNIELLLNRPNNGNALTSSMIEELTNFFEEARDNPNISRIVLRGSGKFFCTGMDLGKNSSPVGKSKSVADAQYDRLTRLFEAIDNSPQVTIACINGSAFGGGVGLAFACDIRLAVKSATTTLSEVKLGLCPATISKYVIREWGVAFTRECMLSARPISVTELKSLGVITEMVESEQELIELKDDYLEKLKRAAPGASKMCKELIMLAYKEGGGKGQADGIKDLFDRMMTPESEAAVGLREFQAGRRNIDWDSLKRQSGRPKL